MQRFLYVCTAFTTLKATYVHILTYWRNFSAVIFHSLNSCTSIVIIKQVPTFEHRSEEDWTTNYCKKRNYLPGVMGHEFESRQGMGWLLKKVNGAQF
jgi:hypothetical protein